MRLWIVFAAAALAACEHRPPPPSPATAPASTPADAAATASDAAAVAMAPVAPAAPVDAAPDCAPHVQPEPAATACAPPPPDVVARVDQLLAPISKKDPLTRPDRVYSCGLARGWYVHASFEPAAGFRGDDVFCPPARGDCGAEATWLVPPTGKPIRQRTVQIGAALDIDGDGRADQLMSDGKTQTVEFDGGRAPLRLPAVGGFVPWHGAWIWWDGDGDPAQGFVRDGAHAYHVTQAGLVEAPDVLDAMWKDTVAARCPAKDVIEDADLPWPEGVARITCDGPGAEVKARLEAQLTTALVDRTRAHGIRILDGRPRMEWSCNPRELTLARTYCEGLPGKSCVGSDNDTHWVHELWVGHADGLTLLDRMTSSSILLEWSVNSDRFLVAHSDLDGDGAPDPIFDLSSHEGGSAMDDHRYQAVVGGKLVDITGTSLRRGDTIEVHPIPHGIELVTQVAAQDDKPAKTERQRYIWSQGKMRRAH